MPSPPRLSWLNLKQQLHADFVRRLDPKWLASHIEQPGLRRELRLVVERLLDTLNPLLNRLERERAIVEVLADALGYGPLEMFFAADNVQDIWVDGLDQIRVRCGADITAVDVAFDSLEQLYLIVGRLLGTLSKPLEPAPNSVVERAETPANFFLTVRFPATRQASPCLHFHRLRPAGSPQPISPPRLQARELQLFIRFVQGCHAAGVAELPTADEATLRQLAEQIVRDFLAEAASTTRAEEGKRLVTLLLHEARQQ